MRQRRTATIALAAVLVIAGTGAGCGSRSRKKTPTRVTYEDCEVSDQVAREPDCGYSERAGTYRVGFHAQAGWTWHWWSWVVVGRDSSAPAGWVPPHGLRPPTEGGRAAKPSSTRTAPRKLKDPVPPAPKITRKKSG